MATTDMYREAFERLKHELTPEEKEAIMKAQGQMKNHLRIGALAGGGLGYGLTTVRRFRGFQKAGIIFGGVVIGSQLGFVSGTLSGINTIKALPNSDHILKTIQTIQQEMKTRQQSQSTPGLPQPQQQQQQRIDGENTALSQQFEKDKIYDNPYDASLHRPKQRSTPPIRGPQPAEQQSGGWLGGWGGYQKSSDTSAQPPPPRPRSEFDTPPPIESPPPPQQPPNKWAQLRGTGAQQPSAWDKIRQDRGQQQMRQQQNSRDAGNVGQTSYSFSNAYEDSQLPTEREASFKESAWREEQPRQAGSSGVQFGEDFSRSREDFGTDPTTAAKGQQRTNKYGDVY